MSENNEHTLGEDFEAPFAAIRECLVASELFPKGLTGACFSGAFLSDFILKEKGYESQIVTNHRHCFSRFFVEGVPHILDLTATQISRKRYDEVSILTEREAKGRLTPMKRNFYDEIMLFRDSRDLLMPRGDEEVLVARAVVYYLAGLLGQKALYDEYNKIESLTQLNAFADTLVSECRNLLSDKVMPLGQAKVNIGRERKHETSFGMGF